MQLMGKIKRGFVMERDGRVCAVRDMDFAFHLRLSAFIRGQKEVLALLESE